jgi:hypothetical protein
MLRLSIALFLLVTLPALAEPSAVQPKGAVTLATGGGVVIAAPPCSALVQRADYVPGIDGAGHAVVPADLSDTSKIDTETPAIEIDAHLAARFGSPSSGARVGRTILGYVTVRDGRAYFNGEPLAPEANDAMISACKAQK